MSAQSLPGKVAKGIANVSVTADVMRFQVKGDELQGTRLFVVNIASNPPRTQIRGKNFEFFLPDGAQVDQGMAMAAGREPVKSSPLAGKENNRYRFVFPLRSGETQFQVAFHLKYSGQLDIDPRELYGAQHFVVMVPATMQFTAAPGITFESMADPRQPDALVRVVSNTRAGQPLSFRITGTGTLKEPGDDSLGTPHPIEESGSTASGASPSNLDSGKEPNAPAGFSGSLNGYLWYLLGGLALLLGAGTIYPKARRRSMIDLDSDHPRSAPSSSQSSHLENIKNEMFRLEVAHKQGRISLPEYQRARAALDRNLKRAIKRAPQN